MTGWRKSIAGLCIFSAGTAAAFFGTGLVRDVQFARAEQQVQTSHEQLQKVQDLATVFREVSHVIEPTVVNIKVTKASRSIAQNLPFDDEMLRRFFPDRDGDGEPDLPEGLGQNVPQQGTGSGVIMQVEGNTGYIVTNNHVAGDATEMEITLNDGRTINNAKLVGADPKTDLAVLKIESDHLMAAKWGDSGDLQKGDWVLAFGSPLGYVGSMTHGIVSALGRKNIGILGPMGYENFIQVDAPINPGNSGGPLVDIHGNVVGINTAIASMTGGSMGIGFAIPSNQAKTVFETLRDKGKITRGYLGVGIDDVASPRSPDAKPILESLDYKGKDGVLVMTVGSDSPAAGKLRTGDIITGYKGEKVTNVTELRNAVASTPPGTEVKIGVVRDGKPMEETVKVAEQPAELAMGRNGRGGGRGDQATAPSLGARLSDLNDELAERFGLSELKDQGGALVTSVQPGSLADREGLRPGDLITRVGKQRVKSADEALEALNKQDLSKGVTLYVTNRDESKLIMIRSGNH